MERKTIYLISAVIVVLLVAGGVAYYLTTLPPTVSIELGYEKGRGPGVEELVVRTFSSQETGVTAVASGDVDVFLWPVTSKVIASLPQYAENIKFIRAASAYYSLVFNPYSNKSATDPWHKPVVTVTVENKTKTVFNPFAIAKVRYALNFVNRKAIIDSILGGSGEPRYSPIALSEPAGSKFLDVYSELNLTETGDEDLVVKLINDTLTEYAQHVSGLEYKDGKWYFNGEPITVKFYIRIEDERLEIGRYIASLLEKAGLTVEKVETDRWKCIMTVYLTDPADYLWNIYTEGWVSMTSWKYVEDAISQMYAPWYGWMPGLLVEGWWQYENKTIDELSQYGYFMAKNETDYWNTWKEVVKLGIEESVRVFLATTYEYFAVNKERVKDYIYDLFAGLWARWFLQTFNTTTGRATVAEYAAPGALFMSAWNPIGGFEDVYTMLLWQVIRDYGVYVHPVTGEPIPVRAHYEVTHGPLTVPDSAVVYNSTSDKWVSVGGKKALVKVVFNYTLSKWHHGRPMDITDFMYTVAFMYEWSHKDGPDDPYYDAAYASSILPSLSYIVGWEFKEPGTVIVYGNYTHVISDDVTAMFYDVFPTVPWELLRVMEECVAFNGTVTGNTYSWDGSVGEWINMISPEHVKDFKAYAEKFFSEGSVPPALKDYLTAAEARVRYGALIKFIDTYGHAVISNGPFRVTDYNPDPASLYVKLVAFRDPSYPAEVSAAAWREKIKITVPEITDYYVPRIFVLNKTAPADLHMNVTVLYGGQPTENLTVRVLLKTKDGDVLYMTEAKTDKNGVANITIPGSVLKDNITTSGTYVIEFQAYREVGEPLDLVVTYVDITVTG